MLDTVIKIAGIVVNAIATFVKIAEMLQNHKAKKEHQKSNRPIPR